MPGKKAPEGLRREQILDAAYRVASHKGIDGLTVRAVAAKARLSHGLVLFHFKRRDQLLRALLDRLLASTSELHEAPEIARIAAPLDRLHALLHQEMDRLGNDPRRVRLFYDYWVLGTRNAAIGARIAAELERYRQSFRAIIHDVIRADPGALPARHDRGARRRHRQLHQWLRRAGDDRPEAFRPGRVSRGRRGTARAARRLRE